MTIIIFYVGRTISLRKLKHLTRNILQQVALKQPLILRLVDCKGDLEGCDIVEFVEKIKKLQVRR
jgi:hypothetical protein